MTAAGVEAEVPASVHDFDVRPPVHVTASLQLPSIRNGTGSVGSASSMRTGASVASEASGSASHAGGSRAGSRGGILVQPPAMLLSNLDALCFNTFAFAVREYADSIIQIARLSRRMRHAESRALGQL
ncbi:hypothetical protein EON66_08105 [archaeon]|nr:MAG: hypothetical protein EON66_08105 [archaeon]